MYIKVLKAINTAAWGILIGLLMVLVDFYLIPGGLY